jgi:hypothetical protein
MNERMLAALYQHYPTLIGSILGLLLILWPPPKRAEEEARRQARLAELANGSDERFFEERRELQAYGPDSAGPFRLWGALLLLLSLSLLFL